MDHKILYVSLVFTLLSSLSPPTPSFNGHPFMNMREREREAYSVDVMYTCSWGQLRNYVEVSFHHFMISKGNHFLCTCTSLLYTTDGFSHSQLTLLLRWWRAVSFTFIYFFRQAANRGATIFLGISNSSSLGAGTKQSSRTSEKGAHLPIPSI